MEITAITQRLIERFPQHWSQIRCLLRESEDFRELCRDYSACVDMQQRWQSLNTPTTQKWFDEYEVLRRELETEISNFLKKADTRE